MTDGPSVGCYKEVALDLLLRICCAPDVCWIIARIRHHYNLFHFVNDNVLYHSLSGLTSPRVEQPRIQTSECLHL